MGCNGLGVNLICPYVSFFDRLQQQSLKLHWKRAQEAKRIYDSRCREEVACNQVYHQEIARSGKSSREADKVRQKYSYRLRLRHIGFSLGTQFAQTLNRALHIPAAKVNKCREVALGGGAWVAAATFGLLGQLK